MSAPGCWCAVRRVPYGLLPDGVTVRTRVPRLAGDAGNSRPFLAAAVVRRVHACQRSCPPGYAAPGRVDRHGALWLGRGQLNGAPNPFVSQLGNDYRLMNVRGDVGYTVEFVRSLCPKATPRQWRKRPRHKRDSNTHIGRKLGEASRLRERHVATATRALGTRRTQGALRGKSLDAV